MAFSLKNNGLIGARDIFIDMKISSDIQGMKIGTNFDFRISPPKTQSSLGSVSYYDNIQLNTGDELFTVDAGTDHWNATFETKALQPQRTVKSKHRMVIGATASGTIEIEAKIYADILPKPIIQKLKINLEIKQANVMAIDLLKNSGIFPVNEKSKNNDKPKHNAGSRRYNRFPANAKK